MPRRGALHHGGYDGDGREVPFVERRRDVRRFGSWNGMEPGNRLRG